MADDSITRKSDDSISSTGCCPSDVKLFKIVAVDVRVKNEVVSEDEANANDTDGVPNDQPGFDCKKKNSEASESGGRLVTPNESGSMKVEDSISSTAHFPSNAEPLDLVVAKVKVKQELVSDDKMEPNDSGKTSSSLFSIEDKIRDVNAANIVALSEATLPIKNGTLCMNSDYFMDIVIRKEEDLGMDLEEDQSDWNPDISIKNEELRYHEAENLKISQEADEFDKNDSNHQLVTVSGVGDLKPIIIKRDESGCLQVVSIKNEEFPCHTEKMLHETESSQETADFDKNECSYPLLVNSDIVDAKPIIIQREDLLQGDSPPCTDHKLISSKDCSSKSKKKPVLKHRPAVPSLERPFPCVLCLSSFKFARQLGEHLLTHSNDEKFSCLFCNSKFKCIVTLTQHASVHSYQRPFLCLYCPAKWKRETDLNKHLVIHAERKPFSCERCSAKFAAMSDLTDHCAPVHSKNKQFVSTHCSLKFSCRSVFNRHLATYSGKELPKQSEACSNEGPFSCRKCPSKFETKLQLKHHRIFHYDPKKPYACFFCSEKFKFKTLLNRHLADIHSWIRPFACMHCAGKFKFKRDLNNHLRLHSNENKFTCSRCPFKFATKSGLSCHLVTHSVDESFSHSSENPVTQSVKEPFSNLSNNQASHSVEELSYPILEDEETLEEHFFCDTSEQSVSCPYCFSNFQTQLEVNDHLVTHFDEMPISLDARPFSCPYCPRKFKVMKHLKSHLLVHSNEKPFACFHCPMKFKSKQSLDLHLMNIHSHARLFACYLCRSKFQTNSALNCHMMETHSDPRPFACSLCSAKFKRKSHLKGHLQVHSDERPFLCLYCDWKSKSKKNLRAHFRTHRGRGPSLVNTT